MPALKKSSPQQYAQFRQMVEALVAADGKVDLFEYCLRTVLFSYLDVHFGLKKPPAVRYRTTDAVAQPAGRGALDAGLRRARASPDDVQRAFQAGAGGCCPQAAMLAPRAMHAASLRRRLGRAGPGRPPVKRDVIAAVTACIAADGKVTMEESELLRAMPPCWPAPCRRFPPRRLTIIP